MCSFGVVFDVSCVLSYVFLFIVLSICFLWFINFSGSCCYLYKFLIAVRFLVVLVFLMSIAALNTLSTLL